MERRCPHCKQMIPRATYQPARICRRCNVPIERHMKWRFVQVKGKTLIEHRYCDNPFEYKPRADEGGVR